MADGFFEGVRRRAEIATLGLHEHVGDAGEVAALDGHGADAPFDLAVGPQEHGFSLRTEAYGHGREPLDVLERGVIRAVGATKERSIDVRVVAATHRDLRSRIATGAFREDLLYRLEVVAIDLPPLRARPDDIPHLVHHFLDDARQRHPRTVVERVSPSVMARMMAYAWPGNVRELAHTVERFVVLGQHPEITESDLPPQMQPQKAPRVLTPTPPVAAENPNAENPNEEVVTMREAQRRYALWVYRKLGEHRARAAERLGIDVKTLSKLLSEPPDNDGGG